MVLFFGSDRGEIDMHSVLRNSVETWSEMKLEKVTFSRMNNHSSIALP